MYCRTIVSQTHVPAQCRFENGFRDHVAWASHLNVESASGCVHLHLRESLPCRKHHLSASRSLTTSLQFCMVVVCPRGTCPLPLLLHPQSGSRFGLPLCFGESSTESLQWLPPRGGGGTQGLGLGFGFRIVKAPPSKYSDGEPLRTPPNSRQVLMMQANFSS